MLDATPELLEAVRLYQPLFRFVLDDIAALSPNDLAARPLHDLARLVQLALWSSRSYQRLHDAAPLMRAIASILVRDGRTRALLHQLFFYLLRTSPPDVEVAAVRTILLEVAGPAGQEDVMNAADQLIAEGERRGEAHGEARGLRAGLAIVLSSRSLSLSEVAKARVASCADVATLARWLERAATATSEADVFANGAEPPR
jgi:hypothetical protein